MNKMMCGEAIAIAIIAVLLELLFYYASKWGLFLEYQRSVNYWLFFVSFLILYKVNK